jgi:hypothetical protein
MIICVAMIVVGASVREMSASWTTTSAPSSQGDLRQMADRSADGFEYMSVLSNDSAADQCEQQERNPKTSLHEYLSKFLLHQ